MGRESTETTLEKNESALETIKRGARHVWRAIALRNSVGSVDFVWRSQIDLQTVRQAIFQFDSSVTEHQIIHDIRIPRALGAALVGSFLAVSGAIMQGMTRNPLAEPSVMGVMDGAALAIAIMFAFSASVSGTSLMFAAFIGAGAGAAFVFMIGSLARGGLSPAKLALAGVTVGAFF